MRTLPDMGTLLVCTDFTDDGAWVQLQDEATREYRPDAGQPEGFRAYVEPVSDPQWAGATWEAVKAAAPVDSTGPCVLFIADSRTFASAEHPILVVDLDDKLLSLADFPEIADRTPLRCVPSELWSVENNLSISNMVWEDFAGAVGDDGVFRGYEPAPPPTPEQTAEAERQAQLAEQRWQKLQREEQRRQEQDRLAAELTYWDGELPSAQVRAVAGNARAMARLDIGLAEAIAAASPDTQRSIARWAARRAYETAGIAELDWVAPALRALDQGQRLQLPFNNWELLRQLLDRVQQALNSNPSGTHMAIALQTDMNVRAVFDPAGPDPLDAALQALYAAAVTFSRNDYHALLDDVRRVYSL
jgi:hypothetical protein